MTRHSNFTCIHKINQQFSCIGCTMFVCHTLKEQPELDVKLKLLWEYNGAPVMRANRHTAPVRHFITWPWFQHFKPSHKWQTKEMWLALKTCSRSDWKTHYNQSGFFFDKPSHILQVCFVSSVRQLQLLETRPHLRCGAFWMASHSYSDWEHYATASLKHCYGNTSGLVLSKQQRGSKAISLQ